MKLSEGQIRVLASDGHLLVTGGPGSGKTTVSILKAAEIAGSGLGAGQEIMFLSFARATVSRVIESIEHEHEIEPAQKLLIDVETYHSFFWRIIKSHGYLLGLPRKLSILPPAGEAVALSGVRSRFGPSKKLSVEEEAAKKDAENSERARLAHEEGLVCFDLFAGLVSEIILGSDRICRLVAAKYPVIILDEFQDTNALQWRVVQALGKHCRLIALADPDQRIYDWLGADPKRLDHFREAFSPTEEDLRSDNHRSNGTEIATFGNDLLSGNFSQRAYNGITCVTFEPYPDQAMTALLDETNSACRRLDEIGVDRWTLAILVPTKKLTRLVSDAFRRPPNGSDELSHTAIVDMESAILAAEVISFLLQPAETERHFEEFIGLVCNFFQGKGGNEPTRKALDEASRIRRAYDDWLTRQGEGKPLRKSSILKGMLAVYERTRNLQLSGSPDKDWVNVRRELESGTCLRLIDVWKEARNIRLLDRGTQLRQALAQDWRDSGAYLNALSITRQAFVQEHFSTGSKPEHGVVVMNMDKSKGKQFNEVIIFEGWPIYKDKEIVYNGDRIVPFNSPENINEQVRQKMRVSVTRAKLRTTIMTPQGDVCVLFVR